MEHFLESDFLNSKNQEILNKHLEHCNTEFWDKPQQMERLLDLTAHTVMYIKYAKLSVDPNELYAISAIRRGHHIIRPLKILLEAYTHPKIRIRLYASTMVKRSMLLFKLYTEIGKLRRIAIDLESPVNDVFTALSCAEEVSLLLVDLEQSSQGRGTEILQSLTIFDQSEWYKQYAEYILPRLYYEKDKTKIETFINLMFKTNDEDNMQPEAFDFILKNAGSILAYCFLRWEDPNALVVAEDFVKTFMGSEASIGSMVKYVEQKLIWSLFRAMGEPGLKEQEQVIIPLKFVHRTTHSCVRLQKPFM